MRVLCLAALAALAAAAADPGIVGRWRTVDDKTGKPRAIVAIWEHNGQYFGKVEANLDPKNARERCDLCKDERKNQPMIGLVILRSLKRTGDEYGGGDILDPDNGTVYRCKARLTEGGKKLIVRGYIGFSLLGRSQTWTREP